jgi:hypothetical protein
MSNVREFGAQGDGQHDDTAAIQHALEMGDGTLEFPRGEYRLTHPITVDLTKTGRTGLSGDLGTAKLLMDGPGPAFEFIGSHQKTADPNGFRPEQWQFERMPTVQDIEIEGRHPEADGLRFRGVMQPTLSGVLLRQLRHGVHITERARNVLITGCHIYHNTGIGVFLDRVNLHQCNITGSHISYNRLGGIRIENSEIRNLQITGNDIEYNNNRAFAVPDADGIPTAEVYIDCGETGSIREGTIASNTIQATYSPNGANIRMIGQATAESHKAGMWTITGNLIGSQATNVHLTSVRGVTIVGNYVYSGHHRNLLLEHCRNIVVSGNNFGHNPDYRDKMLCTGIRLDDCWDCLLTGLQIEDAVEGRHTVVDAQAIVRSGVIELVNCTRVNCQGVQVKDGSPVGWLVQNGSDIVLTGCTVLETREPPLMDAALVWDGAAGRNLIQGCVANRPVRLPESVTSVGNLFPQ